MIRRCLASLSGACLSMLEGYARCLGEECVYVTSRTSQITGRLSDMADNEDLRPPVVVEYSIEWPEQGAFDDGTFEIPRDEWDAMTPTERAQRCQVGAEEFVQNAIGWGWNIPNPDDFAAAEENL